jgi:hypothetical protein
MHSPTRNRCRVSINFFLYPVFGGLGEGRNLGRLDVLAARDFVRRGGEMSLGRLLRGELDALART